MPGQPSLTAVALPLVPRAVMLNAEPVLVYAGINTLPGQPFEVGVTTPRMILRRDLDRADGSVHLRRIERPEGFAAAARSGSEMYFHLLADGSVVQSASIEPADNARTTFDPPLLTLSPDLEPGQPHRQEVDMQVVSARDGSPRESGRAVNTVTYEGVETVSTPAGRFSARRVRAVFEADLGMAIVHNETLQWFADGVGMVAERRRQVVRVLGVPTRQRAEDWVLIGLGESAAEE